MPLKPRDDGSGKLQTGRPTKYKPEYCAKMIEFFNISPTREIVDVTTSNNGATTERYREIPNKLPFISAFAREIGVNIDSLYEWEKEYDDFSEAMKIARELQKEFLIINGLNGSYNPTAFIFTAKNLTDMRDVQETTTNVNINIADYLTQIPDRTIEANYQVIDNKKPELS